MKVLAHVIPKGDLVEHELTERCACNPMTDDAFICVHHSADKREQYKRQNIPFESKGWEVHILDSSG